MKIKNCYDTETHTTIVFEDDSFQKFEKVRQRPNTITPEDWKTMIGYYLIKNGKQTLGYSASVRLHAFFDEYVEELKHQMKPTENTAAHLLSENTVRRITNLVEDYQRMLLEDK